MRTPVFNALNQTPGNRGFAFLGVGDFAVSGPSAPGRRSAYIGPATPLARVATARPATIFNALNPRPHRAGRAIPTARWSTRFSTRFNALNLTPNPIPNPAQTGGQPMRPPE
jgi:hypothetical protein